MNEHTRNKLKKPLEVAGHEKKNNRPQKTNLFNFSSLAPNDSIKDIGDYNKCLKKIINDKSLGNIAITGDLGIGKSSIIKTFERKNNLKFTYISAIDLNNNECEKKEAIQKELERQLLIQLIAMCKKKNIPFSHFKTIPENRSKMQKFLWLFFYPSFSALTAICIFKFAIRNHLPDIFPDYSLNWLLFLIIGLYTAFSIWGLIRMITNNYKLPKLSYKFAKGSHEASAELERKAIEPESLDNNLYEILYIIEQLIDKRKFIQKKHKPVLIIEDLDRYPGDICIPILKKFKQINDMLNQRYYHNNSNYGKHFKFIYVLKDEIFSDENNVKNIWEKDPYKFFDIIIPILPKFGFFNSSETIKDKFADDKIEEYFINKISFYLYDYRKLNTIQNEYNIYKIQLSSKHLKDKYKNTQLLAFVIYKVFYPQDYYELYKIKPNTNIPKSEFFKQILFPKTKNDFTDVNDYFKEYLQNIIGNSILIFMNFPEVTLRQLKETIIIKEKIKNLNDVNLIGVNLTDADLTDANLTRAKLIDSHLKGANLAHANLTRANLTRADLSFADLTGADLAHANLNNANLTGADLNGAKLTSANLNNANLNGANLNGASLARAKLTRANLTDSHLNGAKFKNSDLRETIISNNLNNVTFTGVKLYRSDLTKYDDYIRNGIITITKPIIQENENKKFKEYCSYKYNKDINDFELL